MQKGCTCGSWATLPSDSHLCSHSGGQQQSSHIYQFIVNDHSCSVHPSANDRLPSKVLQLFFCLFFFGSRKHPCSEHKTIWCYNKPFCWLKSKMRHRGVVKIFESTKDSWLNHFPDFRMTHKFVTLWGNSLKASWQAPPVWPVAKKHITFQL